MPIVTISRRSLIATGLAAGTAAIFAPAFAQEQMTAEKMKKLIDYTHKANKENNKTPTRFSTTVTPFLFGSTEEVLLHQIGYEEGAIKERFAVTLNLSQQQIVLFSRTDDVIYFHRTGLHLRREASAINKRNGGASRWTAPEVSKDFTRQMSYWAGKSVS